MEWLLNNRSFLSSPGAPCPNKVKCSAFDMEMIFHSCANKLTFTRKVVHLASYWKWRFLELGNGLFRLIKIFYFFHPSLILHFLGPGDKGNWESTKVKFLTEPEYILTCNIYTMLQLASLSSICDTRHSLCEVFWWAPHYILYCLQSFLKGGWKTILWSPCVTEKHGALENASKTTVPSSCFVKVSL